MKIDHQDNCENRFSSISIDFHRSIVINFIDFHRYRIFLLRFDFSEKRNGQSMDKRLALFAIKGEEFKQNFKLLEPIFL